MACSSLLSDLCDPTGVPSQFSGGCQERRNDSQCGIVAAPPEHLWREAPSVPDTLPAFFASCDATCAAFSTEHIAPWHSMPTAAVAATETCGLAALRRASRLGDSWPTIVAPISNVESAP